MPNFENPVPPNGDGNLNNNLSNNARFNLQAQIYGPLNLDANNSNPEPQALAMTPMTVVPMLTSFNPSLSVADLTKDGKFQSDPLSELPSNDYPSLPPNQAPSIKVEYQNLDNVSKQQPPNFIIKENGSIQCVKNPEGNPPTSQIIIQVERKDKQITAPPANEQLAINNLVTYLGKRIQANYANNLPDVTLKNGTVIKQVGIIDQQNLISASVEHTFGDKIAPADLTTLPPRQPEIPSSVNSLSGAMEQVAGSNGGSTSLDRSTVSQALPSIEGVPQAPGEANAIIASQQMVASLFSPDKSYPYHTVREANGIGYEVGNYGLNQFTVGNFLESFLTPDILAKLGHPPDWSKLAKLLESDPKLMQEFEQEMQKALLAQASLLQKEANLHKLPPDDKIRLAANQLTAFAKNFDNPKFSQGFAELVTKLPGSGGKITKAEVAQYLPKALQDVMANDNVQNFAKQLGITDLNKITASQAGEIGLSFYLGHIPNSSELTNASDAQYITAGSNMYRLALAQLGSLGDINVSDIQGKIAVNASSDVGRSMWTHYMNNGNLGCAASVSEVLQSLGFSYANSALVYGLQHQLEAHGWTSTTKPQAGDVVLGYRNMDANGGGGAHCGIVGDNGIVYDNHSSTGKWSQDHLDYFSQRNFHAGVIYLKPPG